MQETTGKRYVSDGEGNRERADGGWKHQIFADIKSCAFRHS